MSTSLKTIDPRIAHAVQEFICRISRRYPVQKAWLFGSRARGTARADSEADIAVLLSGSRTHFLDTRLEMVDIAYDVLLETAVHIQPLPVWEAEWEHPETHSNPRLLQNIQQEGIALPIA